MKTIKIAGRTVKIVRKELDDLHGQCDVDNLTIYLDNSAGPDTELHERIHMALLLTGLHELIGDKKSEAVCRCLELLEPYLELRYDGSGTDGV